MHFLHRISHTIEDESLLEWTNPINALKLTTQMDFSSLKYREARHILYFAIGNSYWELISDLLEINRTSLVRLGACLRP